MSRSKRRIWSGSSASCTFLPSPALLSAAILATIMSPLPSGDPPASSSIAFVICHGFDTVEVGCMLFSYLEVQILLASHALYYLRLYFH